MKDMKNKKMKRKKEKIEIQEMGNLDVKMKSIARKSTLIALLTVAVVLFFAFYFLLIPINIHSVDFWILAFFSTGIFAIMNNLSFSTLYETQDLFREEKDEWKAYSIPYRKKNNKLLFVPLGILVVFALAWATGASIFHAARYASILQVEDAKFEEDLAETLNTDSIALMDTQSAQMLGDREIGSLSELVSQFDVSNDYTQIDYNGTPKKVSALKYAGFFKWVNNRKDGVPGYVSVDPVSMSADYYECAEGMVYVPSAYLWQDTARHIWKHYMTELLGVPHFEIDEEGNPYYVAPVYKKTISLFGGDTMKGAVILNPVDGEMQYYDLADVPQWVDEVYDGDLICQQYNWFGQLENGFVNSVIAKKGCKQVTTYRSSEEEDAAPTSDYGFVAKDGDIWIYTGVTSVNGDSSNIGFLLANERTGEAHYYTVAGADEKSAMAAAEGEVQEKRYQASFPSLINVDGNPTYICVLKDANGLVKLYAAVNVEQYNLVVTASNQKECIQKYRSVIASAGQEQGSAEEGSDGTEAGGEGAQPQQGNGVTDEEEALEPTGEADISIADIRYIDVDGNTYIYLITDKQEIYRAKAADHEEMLLLQVGDQAHLTLHEKEILEFTLKQCMGTKPENLP